MGTIVTAPNPVTPDKNLGGRPRLEDTPDNAIRMQRMLRQLRSALPFPSSISGRPLIVRGYAYWIYKRDQEYPPAARHGLIRPTLPDVALAELHDRAATHVRAELLRRLDEHFAAFRRSEVVWGLRLAADRASNPCPFYVADLPGTYRGDPPTPIGRHGEASLDSAAAVSDAVDLVKVTLKDLERRRELLVVDEPDAIAVAERVAELLREDGSPERQLRRLLERANAVEFVHLAADTDTGRRPLAPNVVSGLRM